MASLLEVVAMTVLVMVLSLITNNVVVVVVAEATWCVARSDAGEKGLQTALDYACGAGADCAPVQASGLCYLPNTVQSHASYAFNSYYQRKANAPGSCDFAGTATLVKTDPSYGSCVFPSSSSTAGGTGGTNTNTTASLNAPPPPGTTTPIYSGSLNAPPPPGTTTPIYSGGGLTPGLGTVGANTNNSKARLEFSVTTILISLLLSCSLFHVSTILGL